MDLYRAAERLMAMDDATWARHANPWSVYSRFSCLPLIVAAVWSRVWLGWWALVPVGLALAWTFINPRLFPPPDRLDTWAAKGVLGERAFLARAKTAVPARHVRMAHVLTAASALGGVVLVWGLWALEPWAVIGGLAVAMGGKIWFCDRMVWLHEDVQRAASEAEGEADRVGNGGEDGDARGP